MLFEKILDDYYRSDQFESLANKTQKDYLHYSKELYRRFGKRNALRIEPMHVRAMMDEIGKRSVTQANRHKSCMQSVCAWGYERGKLRINPCVGVKKFREKPRERYIDDDEYEAIYRAADDVTRVVIEIAYLCMARITDVLKIQHEDLLEEGMYIEQSKTGRKQIKLWSIRLKAAVDKALTYKHVHGIESVYLIAKLNGEPFSVRGIQRRFSEARKKAGVKDCRIHDMKAKGISDYPGTLYDKQEAAGHTSPIQTDKYDRKVRIVRVVK